MKNLIRFNNIINNLDGRKSLLLHVCCAPCSSDVLSLLNEYFDVTLIYYNPNIDTIEEYNKRLFEIKKLINIVDFKVSLIVFKYDHLEFLNEISGFEDNREGEDRCKKCISLRLSKTYLESTNYDYFSSVLSVSPYKDSDYINEIAGNFDENKYLFNNFKKNDGYKNSIKASIKYGLYRQDYCGCEFSKRRNV